MGEAKKRKTRRDRLIGAQPYCIYCGGVELAKTVDHMPPVAIFSDRQRPAGLEFSSCDACNFGTKGADQVAALVSRMYPDPASDNERRITRNLFQAISNNHSGLLEELFPTPGQIATLAAMSEVVPPNVHAMNAAGPLLNSAMNRFAAKLGLALHFELGGKILEPTGRIGVRWFTNKDAFADEIPSDITKLFPEGKTLRQGRKQVTNQFRYSSIASDDARLSAHFAVFREAFAVTSFVGPGVDIQPHIPTKNLYMPMKGGPAIALLEL